MISLLRLMVSISLIGVLSACVTATPYQPMRNGVGYSDQKLESNRFRVSFSGNSATPRLTVENYVLYRTAEVALERGYDYFILASESTERDVERHGGIGYGFGGFGFGSHSGIGIGIGSGTGIRSKEYQAQADAILMRGKKPADNPAAYDAREVKASLEPAIVRETETE